MCVDIYICDQMPPDAPAVFAHYSKQCARVPPKFYLMNLPRRVCHRSSKAVTPKPLIPEHTGLQNLREKAENTVALRRTSSNLCLPGLTPWLVDGWKMARPSKVGHRNATSFEKNATAQGLTSGCLNNSEQVSCQGRFQALDSSRLYTKMIQNALKCIKEDPSQPFHIICTRYFLFEWAIICVQTSFNILINNTIL